MLIKGYQPPDIDTIQKVSKEFQAAHEGDNCSKQCTTFGPRLQEIVQSEGPITNNPFLQIFVELGQEMFNIAHNPVVLAQSYSKIVKTFFVLGYATAKTEDADNGAYNVRGRFEPLGMADELTDALEQIEQRKEKEE